MKWTKADIARMRGSIDTFFLISRPLTPAFGGRRDEGFTVAFRSWLGAHRVEIIARSHEAAAIICKTRAADSRETAAHFRNHPEVMGSSTPEMIARFEQLAVEDDRGAIREMKLAARVRAEPLPPEVLDYDPSCR
jgi:hypothetical protein